MKQEEVKYLVNNKEYEGKSHEQAIEEIRYLKESQKGFKDLKKELQKSQTIIRNKDKLIEKLQKSHFKNILPTERQKKIKDSKNDEATLRDLNRIMTLIDSEKKVGLTDLAKTCIIKPKIMKGALNFLMKYNFVREVMDGRRLVLEKVE